MSANLAAMSHNGEASFIEAIRVENECERGFELYSGGHLVIARPAFSCTIRPRAGDRVLVSHDAGGNCFILAILEREAEDQAMELDFPGDVSFRAPAGRLSLSGAEEVRISSARRIQTLSPELGLQASETRLSSQRLDVTGESVEARFKEGRLFANRLESVVDTALQCAQNVIRKVEGVETLNVGSLMKTVRETLSIRSKHTVMSARRDMKLDAERIHMG